MLGVLLFAAAAAQPQPSSMPLKTISHIHASPFCTALRENIGHAVRALLENDAAVDSGKSIFLQMAQDRVHRWNSKMVIDAQMQHMGPVITKMVGDLAAIDSALNDLRAIPNQPKTDDERRLLQMRDDLRAVADRQREALDVFSGTYYSYESNRLQGKSNPVAGALSPGNGASAAGGGSDADPAPPPLVLPPIKSAPAPVQSASPAPASTPEPGSLVDMGLAGYTPYAGLFNSLTTIQLQEQPLESNAARTILQYTDECK